MLFILIVVAVVLCMVLFLSLQKIESNEQEDIIEEIMKYDCIDDDEEDETFED